MPRNLLVRWSTFSVVARWLRCLIQLRRKKLLVIDCHSGSLTGNGLAFALAAKASKDFLPVFICWGTWDERPPRSADFHECRLLGVESFISPGRASRWLYRRADVVAYTGYYRQEGESGNRPLRLQLWHGIPLKAVGFLGPPSIPRPQFKCDIAIATSDLTADVISRSFQLSKEPVLLTGEPKTDVLPDDLPGWDWVKGLRRQYSKVIAYIPTWREYAVEEKQAGRGQRADSETMVSVMRRLLDDPRLKDLLARHNAAVVVRMHFLNEPRDFVFKPPFFLMERTHGEAGHLLDQADFVISDYSSLIVDTLVFNKPMILWCEDYDAYTRWTSFPYFDLREMFGWAMKSSSAEIVDWLDDRLAGRPLPAAYADSYARVQALFHSNPRGGAAERILEHVRVALREQSASGRRAVR